MVLIEAQIRQAGRGAARNPSGGGGIRALIGGFLGGGGGLSSTLPPGAKYLELQAPGMSVLEVPLPEKKKRWEERAEGDEVSNSAEHDADIVVSARETIQYISFASLNLFFSLKFARSGWTAAPVGTLARRPAGGYPSSSWGGRTEVSGSSSTLTTIPRGAISENKKGILSLICGVCFRVQT